MKKIFYLFSFALSLHCGAMMGDEDSGAAASSSSAAAAPSSSRKIPAKIFSITYRMQSDNGDVNLIAITEGIDFSRPPECGRPHQCPLVLHHVQEDRWMYWESDKETTLYDYCAPFFSGLTFIPAESKNTDYLRWIAGPSRTQKATEIFRSLPISRTPELLAPLDEYRIHMLWMVDHKFTTPNYRSIRYFDIQPLALDKYKNPTDRTKCYFWIDDETVKFFRFRHRIMEPCPPSIPLPTTYVVGSFIDLKIPSIEGKALCDRPMYVLRMYEKPDDIIVDKKADGVRPLASFIPKHSEYPAADVTMINEVRYKIVVPVSSIIMSSEGLRRHVVATDTWESFTFPETSRLLAPIQIPSIPVTEVTASTSQSAQEPAVASEMELGEDSGAAAPSSLIPEKISVSSITCRMHSDYDGDVVLVVKNTEEIDFNTPPREGFLHRCPLVVTYTQKELTMHWESDASQSLYDYCGPFFGSDIMFNPPESRNIEYLRWIAGPSKDIRAAQRQLPRPRGRFFDFSHWIAGLSPQEPVVSEVTASTSQPQAQQPLVADLPAHEVDGGTKIEETHPAQESAVIDRSVGEAGESEAAQSAPLSSGNLLSLGQAPIPMDDWRWESSSVKSSSSSKTARQPKLDGENSSVKSSSSTSSRVGTFPEQVRSLITKISSLSNVAKKISDKSSQTQLIRQLSAYTPQLKELKETRSVLQKHRTQLSDILLGIARIESEIKKKKAED